MKIDEYIRQLIEKEEIQDGWLLTEEERKYILEKIDPSVTKISRKGNINRFSIIQDENANLFAIYNPDKEKGYAKGSQAIIKIAQNIKTGEYCLVKIQKHHKKEMHASVPGARKEKMHVEKNFYLQGYQEREAQRKSYLFMTELPGISGNEFKKQIPSLTEKEALLFVKNLLEQLNKINNEGLIHRDLHEGNILIDPNDNYKVSIIDWGNVLQQDSRGYAYDYSLSDVQKTGKKHQFANGYDFFLMYSLLEKACEKINNKNIKQFLDAMNSQVYKAGGYEPISLEPILAKVQVELEQISSKENRPSL